MDGNKSTAVMAGRVTPASSLELFPTPPWATRALVKEVLGPVYGLSKTISVWEPSCGRGHMAIPLGNYFPFVFASDVHDWGYGDRRDLDFGFAQKEDCPYGPPQWVIGNPPFRLGEMFIDKALSIATVGVAMFLRLQFIEGVGRFERLMGGDRRPAIIAPFSERVALIEDVWDPQANSATAYAWFIWQIGATATETIVRPIRPGCAVRYSDISDRALATPGEARRRKAAKKAAESK